MSAEVDPIFTPLGPDAASGTLWARFAAQVSARPEAVAVTDGATELTYRQLACRAEHVRERIRQAGVPAGARVGIMVSKSWRFVAGILAVLAHGGTYVPLDPDYPSSRLEFMAADSGIAAVLVEPGTPALAGLQGVEVSDHESRRCTPAEQRHPDCGAYVIYTSGSTGTPKGVLVPDSAINTLFESAAEHFDLTAEDVWTSFHSFSFDFSVWEMWGALRHGGRLVIVPPTVARDPGKFLALLHDERVTVLSQVPSSFKYLVRAYARTEPELALRYVVFGGEALDRPSARTWRSLRADRDALVNMYGITETTVHVTYRRICDEDLVDEAAPTNIGVPLAHLAVALVKDGQVVAPGEDGELFVRGDSLAVEYIGRPDLTVERFPTLDLDGEPRRWYRTGDLGCLNSRGELLYKGRLDSQVNLRGFRIELGEIEGALRAVPEVADAAVAVVAPAGGEPALIAFVVPAVDEIEPRRLSAELRRVCTTALPAHMRPNSYSFLQELPLTASGKLDRSRLVPAPSVHSR